MAKTKYGQRMYRARQANREDFGAASKEYTVNAKTGESIIVQQRGIDEYIVTEMQAGDVKTVYLRPSSAEQIKSRSGVDIMKGKLRNGVTTEAYSQALDRLDEANMPTNLVAKVDGYLKGNCGIGAFDYNDAQNLWRAGQISSRRANSTQEGASLLFSMATEWRSRRS